MSSPQPAAVARRKSAPGAETYREKATRKFKENPWVPLGCLATVGALVVASVKMQRGESQKFNYWLRMRVVAQGLTIVALVAGTYSLRPKDVESTSGDPTLTRNDVDAERKRLERIAKEKEEFEKRLRGAERAEGIEAELRAGRRPVEATGVQARGSTGTTDPPAAGNGGDRRVGGWWGWLTGRGGPRGGMSGTPPESSS